MESSSSSYEDIIYQKIKEAGEKGIPLKELIKELGLDSRTANLAIRKLMNKKVIRKNSVKENGKTVVKYFINEEPTLITVNLDNIIEIPCFTCKNLTKCGNGSVVSPTTCTYLSKFILMNIKGAS